MTCDEILSELRSLKDPAAIEGMARYGITSKSALGAPVPKLRALAKKAGRSHALSEELWETGIYEARVVATLVDNPAEVTEAQMERWGGDLDSWAICDGCCNNLFRKTSFAHAKAVEWSSHPQEYVKRAAFALMASLAVHDKEAADEVFLSYLPIIAREAVDERNFVKKAVNWVLRQIGKRNRVLNRAAIRTARELPDAKAARSATWVARDALREPASDAVQRRLNKNR